jgi:hypothetical protein
MIDAIAAAAGRPRSAKANCCTGVWTNGSSFSPHARRNSKAPPPCLRSTCALRFAHEFSGEARNQDIRQVCLS